MSRQKKHPKQVTIITIAAQGKPDPPKGMCLEDRPLLEANAAGIDLGASEIYVAVPRDRDEQPA